MRKIVYTQVNGRLAVVHPVRNTFPTPEKLTDAEIEQRAWDRLPADAINPLFVDEGAIPSDRTFRNAWKADLTVDMPVAREIHRDRLRAMRAPLMASLDTEYMRADELGDTTEKQRIAARKQALRDVTADPAIEAAGTPEALKAAIPAALNAER